MIGSEPDSDIRLPYYGKKEIGERYYFRIYYNFKSGALLITVMEAIRIGCIVLMKNESLLLMAATIIECGGESFRYIVEFPDLS